MVTTQSPDRVLWSPPSHLTECRGHHLVTWLTITEVSEDVFTSCMGHDYEFHVDVIATDQKM